MSAGFNLIKKKKGKKNALRVPSRKEVAILALNGCGRRDYVGVIQVDLLDRPICNLNATYYQGLQL